MALNRELDRLALGAAYVAPITLAELCGRFIAQYGAAPQTVKYAQRRLVRPLSALGDAQAGDVTTESLQRVLAAVPGKAYRRDIARTLRMVYRFGVENRLVARNPALAVKAPMQRRSERMLPFESWDEVEAVAAECGRWGPLVVFMADTGARPGEAIRLEHRHVHPPTVELPGSKTEGSWRTVHMTRRGVEAVRTPPRALWIRRVFNIHGRPISWPYFWRRGVAPGAQAGWPREAASVLAAPHVRVLVAAGGRADRNSGPPDGARVDGADVPRLRRLVRRDGRRRPRAPRILG